MNDGKTRVRAAVVLAAPVTLLVGWLLEPYVDNPTDPVLLGQAVAAGPDRYLWSQLILGVALVLLMLSMVAIRYYMRDAGEDRWSFLAVPLLLTGFGAAMFVTGAAAVGTWTTVQLGGGGDEVARFIDQAHRVGLPVSGIGFILIDLGLVTLAVAVKKSGILTEGAAWTVVGAFILSVVAGFIPTGWALRVVGVGLLIGLWSIGYRMWQDAAVSAPAPTSVASR